MNVCEVPVVCKDMEYKLVTEDSKTRVYLSLVREFNEAEYEKYYLCKKKKKMIKRIRFIGKNYEVCTSSSCKHDFLSLAFEETLSGKRQPRNWFRSSSGWNCCNRNLHADELACRG